MEVEGRGDLRAVDGHLDWAVVGAQVAGVRPGAKVDPLANIRMAEKAIVLLGIKRKGRPITCITRKRTKV